MAGFVRPGTLPKRPNPIQDMYKVHNSAVEQQAGDYDNIMKGYRDQLNDPLMSEYQDLFNRMKSGGEARFQDTPDARAAITNLGELSKTGGLTEGDQSNLRARGVSPIRAMYGNAMRNVNRQRGLSGGYSPNYGAVMAKMTRDQTGQIGGALRDVNAGIAESVQRGRLSASPQYAAAAGQERDSRNNMEMFNKRDLPGMQVGVLDRIGGSKSDALRGMTNLYGTTPALSNLYGNQAMDIARFQDNVNQRKKSNAFSLLSRAYG